MATNKPGPAVGTKYKTSDQIKQALIESTELLLNEGVPVSEISSRAVTDKAKIDKMYVNRYFGGLDQLFVAVVQDLLTSRMKTLIGTDIFVPELGGDINPIIRQAFAIYSHIAHNRDSQEALTVMVSTIIEVYMQQLSQEFGFSKSEARREAKLGFVLLTGYLSIGHILPIPLTEVQDWLADLHSDRRERSR